jgi:hypothetical protein
MFRRRRLKREAAFKARRMARAERKDVRPTGIDFALWECEFTPTDHAFPVAPRRDELTDDERH